LSSQILDPEGLPDFTLPVSIVGQVIASLAVDIKAQSIGNLKVDIAAQSVGNLNVNLAASSITLNVNITGSAITLNIAIKSPLDASGNVKINLAASSITLNVNVTNSSLNVNATIVGSNITLNVNVTNSSLNVNATITASNVTLNVNIASSSATLNVNITNSRVTLNVNVSDVTIYASSIKLQTTGTQLVPYAYANGITVTVYQTSPNKIGYVYYMHVFASNIDTAQVHSVTIQYVPYGGQGATLLTRRLAPSSYYSEAISFTFLKMDSQDSITVTADNNVYTYVSLVVVEV
jgi:ribosome-associated translation inhibitor RaiA